MVQHQEIYVYIYGSENLCDNPPDTGTVAIIINEFIH